MTRNNIKVTVVCITYKHEEYIADALESFINQKTNFKFQVFVGEDCGGDRTSEIIKVYANKYPDIIIPFIREKNMGAQRNLIDLCQRANSPYIAFCEGDDYWIDEYKLQKQYDFMEANDDVNVCFAKAKIDAPEDWFLRSYFKVNKDNELIFPDCEPIYRYTSDKLKMSDFISVFPAHTSTVFYRWNYAIEIPDWYYEGIIGDWSLFLMQLGDGFAGMLHDVVSVYRRSDVGVYMSASMDEHFMKTRKDMVRVFYGMLTYYESNYKNNYPKIAIENRIKLEIANFIKTALKLKNKEAIVELFSTYPDACMIGLTAFISFYFDSRKMTSMYTWEGNKAIARDITFMRFIRPLVKVYLKYTHFKEMMKNIINKSKRFIGSCKKKFIHFLRVIMYWFFTLVPKKKNLWVFSGFNKNSYFDNTKYFYEYILEHHPEISPVWLTIDNDIYKKLSEENKPVYRMRSLAGTILMSKACVAVTDHFIMSDFSPLYGYNNRTKVVQLWHGVGFKAMGNKHKVLNTSVPGVVYSDDILIKKSDNISTRIKKYCLYLKYAPMRELFERYFMFVCPGKERINMIGKIWNIPRGAYFMAGHPRNINLYKSAEPTKERVKVIYAPTYRFNQTKENEMIDLLIESFSLIEELMNEWNGEFVIRMHPHTWRNYRTKLDNALSIFKNITLDTEKDIYSVLSEYDVLITDYSSISLDFAMLNKPVIYHCHDYEWFCKNEAGFNLDFKKSIPGPMTLDWDETIVKVKEYLENPKKDSTLRFEKCSYFFDPKVNGIDNSERICNEIKRRLGLV